jgi:hypothetical protein
VGSLRLLVPATEATSTRGQRDAADPLGLTMPSGLRSGHGEEGVTTVLLVPGPKARQEIVAMYLYSVVDFS